MRNITICTLVVCACNPFNDAINNSRPYSAPDDSEYWNEEDEEGSEQKLI
jgi:hypothetical protein